MLDFGWKAHEVVKSGRVTIEDMDTIRKWLRGTTYPQITDEQIVLFLLSCENDVSATQTTIRAHYKIKHLSNIFLNRDIDHQHLLQIRNTIRCGIIPNRTPEGYAIAYASLRDTRYWKYQIEESIKLVFMSFELILMGDSPPTGLVVVYDMAGVGLMHLSRIRLRALKTFLDFVQDGLPLQLKVVHILNTAYFFDKLLAIMKPFMKQELVDMLATHPPNIDMEDFFRNHVPRNCMPSDYGGQLPPIEEICAVTTQQMVAKKKYFEAEEAQRKQYKP